MSAHKPGSGAPQSKHVLLESAITEILGKEPWLFCFDSSDRNSSVHQDLLTQAEWAHRDAPDIFPEAIYIPALGLPHVKIGLRRYCLEDTEMRAWLKAQIDIAASVGGLRRLCEVVLKRPRRCRHAPDTSDI